MTTPVSLFRLLSDLRATLTAAGFALAEAGREARLILSATANLSAADLLARPDGNIPPDAAAAARAWAARRAAGEPLSRIKGTREFYGLTFVLSPETLDPRPETEIIVDLGLKFLRNGLPLSHRERVASVGEPGEGLGSLITKTVTPHPSQGFALGPFLPPMGEGNFPHILDLGTGTGCIPIALLTEMPAACAVAVDISQGALDIAAQNAAAHGVAGRLTLIRSNWAADVPKDQKFDLITANPPYIPSGDIPGLMPEVRDHDPIRALDGGAAGLDPYPTLIEVVKTHLKPGGLALFEMGVGQAEDITRLAIKYGLDVTGVTCDDAGIPRVIGVTLRQ